jgi:5-methyltetrahydropteroyltriglutamate--homocysteine methyltransferase
MKRSTQRILTTHVGSLVRPPEVVSILAGKQIGQPFTTEEEAALAQHVTEAVRMQADCGIDVPSDGEFSKSGYNAYISERLGGFEQRETSDVMRSLAGFDRSRDRARFREAYNEIGGAGAGAAGQRRRPMALVCTSPIEYTGQDLVAADISRFKAALDGADVEEAFIPAIAPGTIERQRPNEYYASDEDYLEGLARAMHVEYRMIVEAGFILQLDDPRLMTEYDFFEVAPTPEEYRNFAMPRIEALNLALEGLPRDRIRYHVCWGSWHGPHSTDIELKDIAEALLKINAGAFSVEAANPRHEHEYHVWEQVKLPDDTVLIPGVIAHTTNCVEHPEVVAERITRYAERVGKENVIAGADCGFAQGASTQRVHTQIVWEKFRMLSEGARLATQRLYR